MAPGSSVGPSQVDGPDLAELRTDIPKRTQSLKRRQLHVTSHPRAPGLCCDESVGCLGAGGIMCMTTCAASDLVFTNAPKRLRVHQTPFTRPSQATMHLESADSHEESAEASAKDIGAMDNYSKTVQ